MGSRNLGLLILLLFSFTFVMAGPTYERGTNITLSVPCTIDGAVCSVNATCVGTVLNPQDVVLYNEANMTRNTAVFELDLNTTDTNVNGEYRFAVSCTDGGSSRSKNLVFQVTQYGNENNPSINIILLLFFVALMISYYYIDSKINAKKWYDKTFNQYIGKNYFKAMGSGMLYTILRNPFGTYYVLGFLVLISMYDMVLIYGIESLSFWFLNILYVYAFGVLLVGLMILGNLQEFIMKLMKDTENAVWGLTDGKE